jgi:transposase
MQRLMKGLETKADQAMSLPAAKDSVKKCKVMVPAKAMALREEAYRILGVDLTTIPGISVLHVQTILAELGGDVSKFRSAGAFSSWMGLCPDNDISGGKVLWTGTRKVKNRVAVTLRMAAQSLQKESVSSGRVLPSHANQARGSQSDHRWRAQVGPNHLPHAQNQRAP